MMQKIKRFKELKRQLETLYEKNQKLNIVPTGYKMVISSIGEEIDLLENELNIPQTESKIKEIEKETSRVYSEIQDKRGCVELEESTPSRMKIFTISLATLLILLFIGGISFLPAPENPLLYIERYTFMVSISSIPVIGILVAGGKNKRKIHRLNAEIIDLFDLKESLLKSKKAYTNSLEKAKSDSRLIELSATKDNCTKECEESVELMNELNSAITMLEEQYTNLGIEIARELCGKKKQMISDEEMQAIFPDLKKILESSIKEETAKKYCHK